MAQVALIVMSRAPLAGATKTRLIPKLGAVGARDFHVACLKDLLAECDRWREQQAGLGTPVELGIVITPAGSEQSFRDVGIVWPNGAVVSGQLGETLDARMEHALTATLPEHAGAPKMRALLIGSDLPLLHRRHLSRALASLNTADVVLGPALDGGYYLVGLRRRIPELFAERGPASSAQAPEKLAESPLEQVLDRARRLGLTTALIDPLPDADTPEDLAAILAHPLARELAHRSSLRWLRAALAEPSRAD